MSAEPFAYGIQAPIGSVTPLFHKLKDAEDYIAKLTDSRDEAKIIPLYRSPLYALSGNAEHVDWTDVATAGRAYADNLLNEPTITEVMHRMADEIERLRTNSAERQAIRFMLRHAAVAASDKAFVDSADYKLWHDVLFARLEQK